MNKIIFLLSIIGVFIAQSLGFHAEVGGLILAGLGFIEASKGSGINWAKFFEEVKSAATADQRETVVKGLALDLTDYFQGKGAHAPLTGDKANGSDPNLAGPPVVAGVYDVQAAVDMGYLQLFEILDLTQSTTETFNLINVVNGVTFQQLKPYERAKAYDITSSKSPVARLIFGALMTMLDDWFKYNQYYQAERLVTSVKRKEAAQKAKYHYDLFAALGSGVNQSFATDDATTIDNACAQIISDTKDKGYWMGEEPGFMVLAHTSLKRRLLKAIWPAMAVTGAQNLQGPVFNIKGAVFTPQVANTSYYVILPGNQIVSGTWENLNAEPDRDAGVRGTNLFYRTAYNAALGDSQQVRRNALS